MANPRYESCGILENKAAFSTDIRSARGYFTNQEEIKQTDIHTIVYLKLADTPLIIPPALEQFTELVMMAVNSHYGPSLIDTKNETIAINVVQKLLQTGDRAAATGRHIDLEDYIRIIQNNVWDRELFLVTDTLPPLFFTGSFDASPVIDTLINESNADLLSYKYALLAGEQLPGYSKSVSQQADIAIDKALLKASQNLHRTQLKPYEVVRYTDFDLHQALAAKEETLKTLCSVVFCASPGTSRKVQGPINNPVLEAYCENPQAVTRHSRIITPSQYYMSLAT